MRPLSRLSIEMRRSRGLFNGMVCVDRWPVRIARLHYRCLRRSGFSALAARWMVVGLLDIGREFQWAAPSSSTPELALGRVDTSVTGVHVADELVPAQPVDAPVGARL